MSLSGGDAGCGPSTRCMVTEILAGRSQVPTVSRFDVHKMNNSWRIGPHSSACTRFIDKKMDHLRNEFPPECEICGRPLRQRKTRRMVSCSSCGTKYFAFRDKVKVLTAYEHEFERLYREITRNSSRMHLKPGVKNRLERTPQLPGELERVTDERSLQSQVSEASRERARRRLPSLMRRFRSRWTGLRRQRTWKEDGDCDGTERNNRLSKDSLLCEAGRGSRTEGGASPRAISSCWKMPTREAF